MGLIVVTPPAEEPVTLEEARLQCRVTGSAENALLTAYVKAARQKLETDARIALVRRTLRLKLDEFPRGGGRLLLPKPPLYSLDSIKYIGTDGVQRTLDPSLYQVDDDESSPARVLPAAGTGWPATLSQRANAVEVQYKAGYGTASDVPDLAKAAMLLLVNHLFDNRSAVTAGTIVSETPIGYRELMTSLRVAEVG